MVQTVTSIGYGDLVATNDRQRLEVTIYMLLALSIAATALGIVTDYLLGTPRSDIRARASPGPYRRALMGEVSHASDCAADDQLETMDAEIESLLQEDNDRSKRDLDRRRAPWKQAGGFIGQRKLIGVC